MKLHAISIDLIQGLKRNLTNEERNFEDLKNKLIKTRNIKEAVILKSIQSLISNLLQGIVELLKENDEIE